MTPNEESQRERTMTPTQTKTKTMTEESPEQTYDVSVVIPCLNEEATIEECVRTSLEAIEEAGVSGEVVVVDNGSTDRSIEVAEAAGARVVREQLKGYGRAYLRGFREAKGEFIFMGDGDGTYPFGDLPRFLEKGRAGAELVMGSRFRGEIEPGAMSWDHRFGNRMLSGMLNLLFRSGMSDAHCGLRLISREAAGRMNLRSPGMEFASEMIIQAKRQGLRMAEVPIRYAARPDESHSKLKSIPEGLRHVRYMLSYAGAAWFAVPALAALISGLILLLGPASGGLQILGAILLAAAGLWGEAWYGLRLYARLVHGDEGERAGPAWLRAAGPVIAALLVIGVGIGIWVVVAGHLSRIGSGDARGTLAAIVAGILALSGAAWVAGLRQNSRPERSR
jgi:hypothetical protein